MRRVHEGAVRKESSVSTSMKRGVEHGDQRGEADTVMGTGYIDGHGVSRWCKHTWHLPDSQSPAPTVCVSRKEVLREY